MRSFPALQSLSELPEYFLLLVKGHEVRLLSVCDKTACAVVRSSLSASVSRVRRAPRPCLAPVISVKDGAEYARSFACSCCGGAKAAS